MKKLVVLIFAASAVGAAMAQSVGVSIGINQPGVYGRINIGDVPPPALVLPQPVVVLPQPVAVQRSPIYLYVPPAEQQNWRRYCGRYSACGQPVYFVREDWVRERYVHEHPDWGRRHGDWDHDHGRRDDGPRGDRGHDRGGDDHDHDHGRGDDRR